MRKLFACLVIASLSLLSSAHAATSADPQEGRDYQRYSPPRPTDTPNKIEVTEFFWYGCPHCYDFDPILAAWVKKLPRDVVFQRVPAVFPSRPDGNEPGLWAPAAKLYYALEAMGLADKLHADIFAAIHKNQTLSLTQLGRKESVMAWLDGKGVDTQKFSAMYDSFAVSSKVARAMDLSTHAYDLQGVPAIIINGQYLVVGQPNQSHEAYLAVADALIEKVRKEQRITKR